MDEEKMMILKMLEQGKISSTEAAQLLDALKDKRSSANNSFSKDFGKKVETLSKDLEPKIKKATQTILDKTASLADKISKSLNQSNTFSSFLGGQEKSLELKVGYKENAQLRLNGKNGMVYIKGYNGDKITAKVKYISKGENNTLELIEVGSTAYLNYDEAYFDKVAIEAFIPEALFKKLYIETSNDKIYVDGLKGEEAAIYTSNGVIEAKHCGAKKIELITSNADIILDASAVELNEYNFYDWNLETSNGTIKINTLKRPDLGYDLEAITALNGVQMNLPNMIYKENEKNYIKAASNNYSTAVKKIKLKLETSNAPIIIS